MFGRKKMYKKGLADALRANEAFSRKQEEAIAHMREEVRAGQKKLETALADLGEEIYGIYDYLTSQEKAALYNLTTPLDIKDLPDHEKRLLLATLYQLANNQGESVTDAQRGYIRSVQRYLEITNPQTEIDLSSVGNIDSLEIQKAFLQVVLEFFYLQNGDELSDDQEDFLGWFSVNRNLALSIENRVSRLFNAVGPEGIAEKYGYVPEEVQGEVKSMEETSSDKTEGTKNIVNSFHEVSKSLLDKLEMYRDPDGVLNPIETDNYVYNGDILIDKRTETVRRVHGKKLPWYYDSGIDIVGDTLYFFSSNCRNGSTNDSDVFAFNLNTLDPPEKLFPMTGGRNKTSRSACGTHLAYRDDKQGLCVFDLTTKSTVVVPIHLERSQSIGDIFAVPNGVYFFFDSYPEYSVRFYDYYTQELTTVFKSKVRINKIYAVYESKFYVQYHDDYSSDPYYGIFDIEGALLNQVFSPQTTLDVMLFHLSSEGIIRGYHDQLIYTAKDGIIKAVDYVSGEIREIASCGKDHTYLPGGLFSKSSSWDDPVHFWRLGNWIYFYMNEDRDKPCCVSLDHPGEIQFLSSYDPFSCYEAIEQLPEIVFD